MTIPLLFAFPADLQLEDLLIESETFTLLLTSSRFTQACPSCAHGSSRVHSRYSRRLADLPCQGHAVQLSLKLRRFFCENPACARKTFAEQFPDLAPAYARRTLLKAEDLRRDRLCTWRQSRGTLSLLSGPAGELLDPASRGSRRTPMAPISAPHVLGTDDFAWRKGDHYGTILVDLQSHRPIDLLADREAETFEIWLREHQGVAVVSRDRASAYAEGAKRGAPDAIGVADRCHLVANLRDTLQRLLDRERQCLPPLQESESVASPEPTGMPSVKHQVQGEEAHPEAGERVSVTRAQALRQMRRGKRYERYQAVVELHQQGLGGRAIARQTGLSRNTVRRYLEADSFPEQRVRRKRRSLLDPYLPYLRERWDAGCQNAAQLCRELQDLGYRGSPTTLRALMRGLACFIASICSSHKRPQARSPCTQHISSLFSTSIFFVDQTA